MRKQLQIALLGIVMSFINVSYSQCNYDNIFLQNYSPNCPGVITVPCVNAGEAIGVNVINGNLYTISTCGSSAFDTQLTIYDNLGANVLGYNDDDCGLQSTVYYTATFTGTIHVLVDRYNCNNSATGCVDVDITCDEPIPFTDSNLPIVVINTAGNQSIPDDPKIDATMGIIYNGPGVRNYMTDPFNEYIGDIGIETRGSSSQMFPKKQYGIETRDPLGNRHDVTVFNMAYDNDWILYAPYSDKSLMRNVLAYEMGWDTDQYAPRTKLVEVVLNGSYDGVYVFTEKIKRKDGKVGLDDVEPQDISGNELTGDYIVKVDKTTSGGIIAWTSPYQSYPGSTTYTEFQMHDPDIDSLNATQLNYIENYITGFEDALFGPNFTDPVNGYQPFIDVGSFIDFFLVNEVSKNVDGYRISTYLHKLRMSEGGKFVAGPLWDFNLAFGNANYCAGGNTSGWEIDFYQVCGGGGLQNPYWWNRMVQDPDFTHRLNCRYQELRQGKWHTDSLLARIDSIASYLDESQNRNFQRWPILGNYVWPNNYIGNTYTEEVNYLKTWISDRLIWLDANMFGSCPDLGIETTSTYKLEAYPNPTSKFLEIHLDNGFNNGTLRIIDAVGKIIIEESNLNGTHQVIDLERFDNGIYQVQLIRSEKVIHNRKFSLIK